MTIYRIEIQPGLLGDLYRAQTAPKGTIVFVPGLPSYQHRNIFAEELARQGYDVVQPFYYGSWVSSGDFTVAGCYQTVWDTVDCCRTGSVTNLSTGQQIALTKSRIFLGGISFGSVVLESMLLPDDIEKVFLISAVPVFTKQHVALINFDAQEFVTFLQRGFPFVYRSPDWQEWQRELAGEGKLLSVLKTAMAKVKIFQGEKDDITPAMIKAAFERVPSLNLEIIAGAGHSLTQFDQVDLATRVLTFLED
jgi:pimeloyl-ACP methyl ester carboxylesterase